MEPEKTVTKTEIEKTTKVGAEGCCCSKAFCKFSFFSDEKKKEESTTTPTHKKESPTF